MSTADFTPYPHTSSILNHPAFAGHTSFTLWRLEANPKGKKPLKVPIHYDGVTRHSSANPAPPLPAVLAEWWVGHCRSIGLGHDRSGEAGYIGIGFRPNPANKLACLDIDDCLGPEGQITPNAALWIAQFPGAAIERSHSGKGLHAWFTYTGESPGRRGPRETPMGAIEVYGDGQFIALGDYLYGDALDCTEQMAAVLALYWPAVDRTARPVTAHDWDDKTEAQRAETVEDLRSALALLDADDRDTWVSVGQALVSLGETGRELWEVWSDTDRHPGGSDLEKWWSFTGDRCDYRAIFAKAQARGWVNPRKGGSVLAATVFKGDSPAYATAASGASGLGAVVEVANAAQGSVRLDHLEDALRGYGLVIQHDAFTGYTTISGEPLADRHLRQLRSDFNRCGFKAISQDAMHDAVQRVGDLHACDSLRDWAEGLVWDGVPRTDGLMSAYYGAPDTPYARAVGRYLMTALAGRALVPGIKADMVPVLISGQGCRKSSGIAALSPFPEAAGAIRLDALTDKDTSQALKGKCVLEIPEMSGLRRSEVETVKAWVTTQVDEYRAPYARTPARHPRRFICVATANDAEVLNDPTGSRRWLPIEVMRLGDAAEAIERDREQLWAEGVAIFRASGIAWQEAERLARDEHGAFRVSDAIEDVISRWLDARTDPAQGVSLCEVGAGALGWPLPDMAAQRRIGAAMMALGWVKRNKRSDGHTVVKRWFRI